MKKLIDMIAEAITIMILLLLGLIMGGCADVIEEADTYIVPSDLVVVVQPDPDAERFLYEAFYTAPIDWNQSDIDKVLRARGTLKMAEDYLATKKKAGGGVTFFTVREVLNFVFYAFGEYEEGLDGRAAQPGVLTEEQAWIYGRVKADVWGNLQGIRTYIDALAEDINQTVDDKTMAKIKSAYDVVANLTGIKLPAGIDF